ncbi:MAG TPA: four helix bundle protein [Candidatus Angelobacter sp.]|nr:four helix bundle protein [Candidatus Angelobacter sp.]
MRNYRDLQVWSKAHHLTLELYRVSQRFPREEIYWNHKPTAARRSLDRRESGRRLWTPH